jgi:hypothetical protein
MVVVGTGRAMVRCDPCNALLSAAASAAQAGACFLLAAGPCACWNRGNISAGHRQRVAVRHARLSDCSQWNRGRRAARACDKRLLIDAPHHARMRCALFYISSGLPSGQTGSGHKNISHSGSPKGRFFIPPKSKKEKKQRTMTTYHPPGQSAPPFMTLAGPPYNIIHRELIEAPTRCPFPQQGSWPLPTASTHRSYSLLYSFVRSIPASDTRRTNQPRKEADDFTLALLLRPSSSIEVLVCHSQLPGHTSR